MGHPGILLQLNFPHAGVFPDPLQPRATSKPVEDREMRLKLVTVGPPSRIRQSHPDPAPIDPASSEQLGSVRQLWPFECNKRIDKRGEIR